MNEVSNASEINRLTTEISVLKQQTAWNIIEIGKRLMTVKETLPHGEWGKWLAEEVEFSQENARRFMKIAKECSNSTAMWNLPPTKVFALLDLPPDEREEFVQNNPVGEMSSRELQKAIKENEGLKKKLENATRSAEEAEKERQQSRAEVERLTALLADARTNGTSDEKVKQLENELEEALTEVEKLSEELKKPVEVATATVEKVPEDVERELQELRQKVQEYEAQPQQAGDPAIVKFKAFFDSLVVRFNDLLGALAEIQDTKTHETYKTAVDKLIGKMSERL